MTDQSCSIERGLKSYPAKSLDSLIREKVLLGEIDPRLSVARRGWRVENEGCVLEEDHVWRGTKRIRAHPERPAFLLSHAGPQIPDDTEWPSAKGNGGILCLYL